MAVGEQYIGDSIFDRIGRTRSGNKAIVYWHKPEPKAFVDSGIAYAKELIHGQTYH